MGRAPSHKQSYVPKPQWAKEQDEFRTTTKYPGCKGTFPDCPQEIAPDLVVSECKLCPIYRGK